MRTRQLSTERHSCLQALTSDKAEVRADATAKQRALSAQLTALRAQLDEAVPAKVRGEVVWRVVAVVAGYCCSGDRLWRRGCE